MNPQSEMPRFPSPAGDTATTKYAPVLRRRIFELAVLACFAVILAPVMLVLGLLRIFGLGETVFPTLNQLAEQATGEISEAAFHRY